MNGNKEDHFFEHTALTSLTKTNCRYYAMVTRSLNQNFPHISRLKLTEEMLWNSFFKWRKKEKRIQTRCFDKIAICKRFHGRKKKWNRNTKRQCEKQQRDELSIPRRCNFKSFLNCAFPALSLALCQNYQHFYHFPTKNIPICDFGLLANAASRDFFKQKSLH